ncbi:MAG: hypothetical protein IJS82_03370 [Paludibacteraceae bacterium]|nr:hypothetical protein [Paludibacteraceae bacterium]
MKKIFINHYSLFIILAVLLSSCQDQVQQVTGTYSYKISGSAEVSTDSVVLSNEQGAMDLIRIDTTAALLTFNELRGATYVANATIHGKTIELSPYKRNLTIGSRTYPITASGTGTIYENTLVLTLSYKGEDVSADEILLVCKKN